MTLTLSPLKYAAHKGLASRPGPSLKRRTPEAKKECRND